MIESVFGFVDISQAAVRRFQRALEDGALKGVVDEVGALAFHEAYADRFFPGTSVLHTRARYLFFVPWVYLSLANDRVKLARFKRERTSRLQAVCRKLVDSGETRGVIGRTLDHPPAQPADFSYWSALFRYGLATPHTSRSVIAGRWDPALVVRTAENRRGRAEEKSADPLIAFDIPDAPPDFLEAESTLAFRLTKDEADSLIDGFGAGEASLLSKAARMIRKGARPPTAKHAWVDPLMQEAARELGWQAHLTRARRAAFLAATVRAAYGFVVARRRLDDEKNVAASDAVDSYLDRLKRCHDEGWIEDAAGFEERAEDEVDAHPYVRELFLHVRDRAKAMRRASDATHLFGDDVTEECLGKAERVRKGRRARLHPVTGPARRATFVGSTISVEPLHYRWDVAKQFLCDIQDGLRS